MKQSKSKAISFLMAVVITFNILPYCVANADDAVSIYTANDFAAFMEKCVYDEYSKDKKFVLQNDIDLSGTEIKNAEVFCGIFEGGGHTIKNLTLSFNGSSKGLFATVTKDAQIKDLNIEGNIKVSSSSDTKSVLKQRASALLEKTDIKIDNADNGNTVAGGIVGYNEGKIINCSYTGKIDGQNRVGGISGYNAMTGVIDGCTNTASVSGDKETGGIVGYNEGRIKMSKNTGVICSDADEKTLDIGGICGNNEGAVVICTNNGIVGGESFGDNIGGITGRNSGEIRECVNNGEVNGRRSVGGITGRFEPYTDIDLSYAGAKASLEKQADILKNDINSARSKILDYGLQLLGASGNVSSLMSLLGIDTSATSSRLNNLNSSAVNMMNSITNAINKTSGNNVSGSLKDAIDKGSGDISEIKDSLKSTNDSLSTTLESVDDFLGEFDGKGKEITDTLDELNTALKKGQTDVDDVKDKLSSRLDDMENDIDTLCDKLDYTHTNLNTLIRQLRGISGDTADIIDDLDDIVVNLRNELKKIKNSFDKVSNEISNITSGIKDAIASFKPSFPKDDTPNQSDNNISDDIANDNSSSAGYESVPDEELDSDYEVEPSVVKNILDALSTTVYAEEEKKTAISDLKSIDISLPRLIGGENADTALIKYSINNANVTGTEIAGGIAGSTGFESAVRSGASITLPDGTKVNSDSVLKAVIDSCINSGDITSKGDYVGGVCGKSDIGNIKNSLSTGKAEVTDGSYAGGIAGLSSGDITSCIAINDVDANTYLGGIAGSGKNITNSYSLPRLDGKKDKSGAISGFVTGNIENTYFIDEGLSGISGVNLEGKAEAVKPSEIASSDGNIPIGMKGLSEELFYMASDDIYMPQIKTLAQNNAENIGAMLQSKSAELSKFHFNVRFIDNGKEIKSMTVDYGTVLSDNDIPKLRADGTNVPAWDKDVHSPIIRHTTFNAEYNRATTTISTSETPALLLVESVFDENTTVTAKEEDVQHEFDGYKKGKAYSFTLSKKAYDVIKVHIRDENKKADKIAVQENGKWTLLDCTVDGSYAVFNVGAPCEFVILYKKIPFYVPLSIIFGIILLSGIGLITAKKVRKKHGRTKEKSI